MAPLGHHRPLRPAETDLESWKLLVTVKNIDSYSFMAFSNLICGIEEDQVFSDCTVVFKSTRDQQWK